MSCTECGRKGGCNDRKGAMFEAIDEALRRLYPGRSWGERDDAAAFGAGLSPLDADGLARTLANRLSAATVFRAGDAEETCDYVYVLCLGRPPSLLEWREGALDDARADALRASVRDGEEIKELYLRVALSSLARFAAVQEVALAARREPDGESIVITEAPRAGVFEPALLGRMRRLVTVLGEQGIRHLDFGEILEPPAGFEPGEYAAEWGQSPSIANYLFYPQPPATLVTTLLT